MASTGSSAPPAPPAPSDGARILDWAQRLFQWLRRSRPVAGVGLLAKQTDSGYSISVDPRYFREDHPFKIKVQPEYDTDGIPTAFNASVVYGTIQGTDDGIYTGVPLYEGSGGSLMTSPPSVSFDLTTTNRTNRLEAVVTVNPQGEITDAWLDWVTAAAADTPFVPDDYPDPGDTGTDGTYRHLIGTATVSGTGAEKICTIEQSVTTSLTFLLCGSEGNFYAA